MFLRAAMMVGSPQKHGVWIFQANPKRYDLLDFLARPSTQPGIVDDWTLQCGHGDGAHGMRTTYGPGIDPPKPRYRCWQCECKQFVEDTDRRKRNPKKSQG